MSRRKPQRNAPSIPAPPLSRRKLWGFRLTALAGVPLIVLGLLELGLRLAGFGYPAAFLLKSSNRGEPTFVQNNQFGWRFFGARAARLPAPISIAREKPPGLVRIFVFGESAAYGDPQPRFGLPRMLEAALELRHPGTKFEVVNAAMTGINSHVILPLARDCAKAHADVWVIYMGNNEVVGPFGAGTVFGSQTTPLPLIRAGLALKVSRTGQLLDSLRQAAQKGAASSGEWEGMRAFVRYKVAAADPRLEAVYGNFAQNLRDIIAAGRNSGAKIVLSTVAVNLKDCAPFASLHRPNLSIADLAEWQRWFDAGVQAGQSQELPKAASDFDQAERIDGDFAELRFRRGQCALALHDPVKAQAEFAAARDLDALRFRCDARLNDIIRRQATDNVVLADGEKALAAAAADGIPGADFFYEHVHLTFSGNYFLARALADEVEKTLGLPQAAPWPDAAACAQRLACTARATQLALADIRGRELDVPFTFQFDHDEQMRRLTEMSLGLPPPNSAPALREAKSATEAAVARWPDDAELYEQLAEIKQTEGDLSGAVEACQRSLDLLPSNARCWLLTGILLAQEEKYEAAVAAFKHVFALDPQAVWARQNVALCLEKLGRRDEAVAEVKRAIALKPNYGTAWLTLGQLYEEMGRTNDAVRCYDTALTNRVNQADDMAALARFCFSHRRFDLAATNFAAAVELSPADTGLRLEAGRAFVAAGQHEAAIRQYQAAIELDPTQAQPHMQLAVELGRLRQPALAEGEFREALRLDPNLLQARVDLGIALYEQQKLPEALSQFEEVLQQNPNDPTAKHYVQIIGNGASAR